MSAKKVVFIICALSVSLIGTYVQAKEQNNNLNHILSADVKSAELAQYMLPSELNLGSPLFAQNAESTKTTPDVPFEIIKKPGRALLFSAIIPGTGEFYCKSYLIGSAFLAVEALSWVLYSNFHAKGKDLEDEFETFANAHWNEQAYYEWISDNPDIQQTHELPEKKTQQYYEMIGKYNQFYAGWDDSEGYEYGGELSPNRKQYMDKREDSNVQLKNATTMVSVVLLNHILSAVNAAWTSYRYNKNFAKNKGTSLQFDTIHYANQFCPAISVNMRW